MPNFCESCGSPLEPDALFCMICGAKVEPEEDEPSATGQEQAAPPAPAEEPAPAAAEPIAAPPPVQVPAAEAVSPAAQPRGRSKAPVFAALAVVLLLGGAFAVWRLAGPKPDTGAVPGESPVRQPTSSKPDLKPDVKAEKPNAPADKPAEGGPASVATLRTEVTKALANVSAAGWSDAACKKELPAIASLSKKAEALGRPDLAAYWKSLSFYVQACNAGTRRDRAKAKANFERAAATLLKIPVEELNADPTLKGDAIGTIGSYISLANDIGLPDGYPPVKGLKQLKRKLEQ